MFVSRLLYAIAACATLLAGVDAACPFIIKPSKGDPSVASGWVAQVFANGMKAPRGILFDTLGQLIVVDKGTGLRVFKVTDNGGVCVTSTSSTVIAADTNLNHGLELSGDGKTLYASSVDQMFAYDYDASKPAVSNKRTIITGMYNNGHSTRTLTLSKSRPNLMIVSVGSEGNLDYATADKSSGRSMIKTFNISGNPQYDFNTDGEIIGWGLRNDVGVAEHPTTSGVWSVENSADNIERLGVDIHLSNPGEKLNFFGYINGTSNQSKNWGSNFGYPYCFSAWDTQAVASAGTNSFTDNNVSVGRQFSLTPNSTYSDSFCENNRTAPSLVFHPHTAPIDIKFDTAGETAWISFRGSWNSDPPVGYTLSYVKFANGQPVMSLADSMKAQVDVLSNKNLSACPGSCFRPTGLAIDKQGRIFMASDATGEVWIVSKSNSTSGSTGGSNGSSASNGTRPSSAMSITASGSPLKQFMLFAAQIAFCTAFWLYMV